MLQLTVGTDKELTVTKKEGQWYINDTVADCDIQPQPNGLISILLNNKSYTASIENIDTRQKMVTVKVDGVRHEVSIKEPMDLLLASMGMDLKAMQKIEPVKAPMPGMILKVLVAPGQEIKKGDGLLILEAMKMENVLKATGDARVKSINIQERVAVEKGAVLIELE